MDPKPTIGDDQILVRVLAASIDRGTVHLMTGLPYLMRITGFGLRAPKQPNPGRSLAGTVEAALARGAPQTRATPLHDYGSGTSTRRCLTPSEAAITAHTLQNADDARTGPDVPVETPEFERVQVACEAGHDAFD